MSRYEEIKLKRVDLFERSEDEQTDWNYLISLIEQMKEGIIKLKNKLSNRGAYSICRTDGKPMPLDEVLTIDMILGEIDKALKLLEK